MPRNDRTGHRFERRVPELAGRPRSIPGIDDGDGDPGPGRPRVAEQPVRRDEGEEFVEHGRSGVGSSPVRIGYRAGGGDWKSYGYSARPRRGRACRPVSGRPRPVSGRCRRGHSRPDPGDPRPSFSITNSDGPSRGVSESDTTRLAARAARTASAPRGVGRRAARLHSWLRSVAAEPQEIYRDRPWLFWQFTTTGYVPGIEKPVDRNVFNGTFGDWRQVLPSRPPAKQSVRNAN